MSPEKYHQKSSFIEHLDYNIQGNCNQGIILVEKSSLLQTSQKSKLPKKKTIFTYLETH
jgi:hypothetical protein